MEKGQVKIRHAEPSDYGRVIGVVNTWWSGRQMAPMLPKLFFLHFESTSFVAEDEDGALAGFLVGFLSQTHDDEAYVHFVGVDPRRRGSGLGRELYEHFFDAVRTLAVEAGGDVAVVSHGLALSLLLDLSPDEWQAMPFASVIQVLER